MALPRLSRLAAVARDLLFPPRCIGCEELLAPAALSPLGESEVLCPLCRTAWECAVTETSESTAEDAPRGLAYLVYYHSHASEHGVPEQMIYHLKHRGDPRVFRFVAARLAHRVQAAARQMPTRAPLDKDASLLFTYPPRRRSAVRHDGFDQAERLARYLAVACEGEMVSLVRRTRRGGREQKQLDARGRAENAALSDDLRPHAAERVAGRVVVICDDLRTTGATLLRCANLLVEAGALGVILATVAVTAPRGTQ